MSERDILIGPELLDALLNEPLSANEQRAFFFMVGRADKRNRLTEPLSRIAQETGVGRTDAALAIGSLIRRGLIRIIPIFGATNGPTYLVNPFAVFCGDESTLDEVLEEYDALQ